MLYVLTSAAVIVLVLGFSAHLASGCATVPLLPAAADAPRLVVLTYNVNFGLEGDEAALEAIAAADADLVLLQETTPVWSQVLRERLGALYPHIAEVQRPAAGGQMVLAKQPFEVRETIPSPVKWFPALRLVAQTALGPVQVLNLHLHPPVSPSGSWVSGYFTTGPVRREEVQAFTRGLEPGLPTILAGDFNEEARGDAIAFLKEGGARDAVSDHLGSAPTWRWPVGALTLRFQLDHVLYQGGLRPVDVQVLERGHSDHLPVKVTFVRDESPFAAAGSAARLISPKCSSLRRSGSRG
ncbi:MAG: endonuclease/exonuclease/phosphatase family protein [Myxococcales bacterium]